MTRTVLITGANKGLGLEFARQFLSMGCKVIATCRRSVRATELHALKGNIIIRELDITAENQLSDLKDSLSGVPIDILLLNAGVVGQRNIELGNIDIDDVVNTFKTNTIYPLKVVDSFFQNILLGQEKKIVAISSSMGSIEQNHSGGYYSYRGSKAGLNAIMKSISVDQVSEGIKVLLLHPGWVKTDMGGEDAHINVQESVSGMIKVISNNFESGVFLDYKNNKVPW